jgi:hypothetical protein
MVLDVFHAKHAYDRFYVLKIIKVPYLVICVIIQLSNIKVTNNLANTYTNGQLKLLAISLINEG